MNIFRVTSLDKQWLVYFTFLEILLLQFSKQSLYQVHRVLDAISCLMLSDVTCKIICGKDAITTGENKSIRYCTLDFFVLLSHFRHFIPNPSRKKTLPDLVVRDSKITCQSQGWRTIADQYYVPTLPVYKAEDIMYNR